MKKFLALALTGVIMASTLAACSGGDKGTVIGACFYKFDDTYISTVRQALEIEAKDKATLMLQDGAGDQAKQNDQIDLLIQKKVNVLAVNLVDAAAAQNVVDKAKAAKIPVIFFNREPAADIMKSYDKAKFVGTNAKDAGVIQGQIIKDTWKDTNKDGKMQYVMLQGEADNPEAIARSEFSVSTAKELLKVEAVELEKQICDWDAGKAQSTVEAWIAKHADKIEYIIANNDSMAEGAVAALQSAGYNKEGDTAKYIPVVGVDAVETAKALVKKGVMTGTVVQDGAGMAKAIFALASNAAAGKDPIEGTTYKYDALGYDVRIPYQAFNGK